jgi:hypothetical protein
MRAAGSTTAFGRLAWPQAPARVTMIRDQARRRRRAPWPGTLIRILALGLVGIPATASTVHASACDQAFAAAASRLRSVLAIESGADRAHKQQSCRDYFDHFFEAVNARQAASLCDHGSDHRAELEKLDAGVEAINNVIAAQCGG